MKQVVQGQKVQNWHRPPQPKELVARFHRTRQDAAAQEDLADFFGPVDGWFDDSENDGNKSNVWRHCDSLPNDWFDDSEDDGGPWEDWYGNRWRFYLREQLVKEALTPATALGALHVLLPPSYKREFVAANITPNHDERAEKGIEERLYHYVQRIQGYNGCDSELVATIRIAIGGDDAIRIVTTHAPECSSTLFLFAPFWLRNPNSWNPEGDVSLVEHLLVRYPTPRFLKIQKDDHSADKWVCWLILLGGGSLKSAADIFDWDIPGRLPALLWEIPPDTTPVEACLYAEILRLGGSEVDYQRITADGSFVFDITEYENDRGHDNSVDVDFWRQTATWLIRHRDQITDADSSMILAWARHRFTEARRAQQDAVPFRWKGRTPRATLEQSRAYHEETMRYINRWRGNYRWSARGWGWEPDAEEFKGWSVIELTNSDQLFEEGQAMHHCVGGYGWRCYEGKSAIVSVRYQGSRRVTVEIAPKTGEIIQIHGAYNREADRDELQVVAAWHTSIIRPTATHKCNSNYETCR